MPSDIESLIHDLPRWVNMARHIHHASETYGEQEHKEAMTLCLDELYRHAIELREMYRQGK